MQALTRGPATLRRAKHHDVALMGEAWLSRRHFARGWSPEATSPHETNGMTATRGRFTLLRFTLTLSVITYVDRVAGPFAPIRPWYVPQGALLSASLLSFMFPFSVRR